MGASLPGFFTAHRSPCTCRMPWSLTKYVFSHLTTPASFTRRPSLRSWVAPRKPHLSCYFFHLCSFPFVCMHASSNSSSHLVNLVPLLLPSSSDLSDVALWTRLIFTLQFFGHLLQPHAPQSRVPRFARAATRRMCCGRVGFSSQLGPASLLPDPSSSTAFRDHLWRFRDDGVICGLCGVQGSRCLSVPPMLHHS